MRKPFVVVVTGRPGAGKTTLAHILAQRIHCPALCRDEFKEGYLHTLGGSHASSGHDINRRLYDIFFEAVDVIVTKGVSVVIEAAFQHALWAPKITHLSGIANVALVMCTPPAQIARARWLARALADPARAHFHGDSAVPSAPDATYEPPAMDLPMLWVDTTDGYRPTLEHIVSFALADNR